MSKKRFIFVLLMSFSSLAAMTQNAPVTTAPYITDAVAGNVNVEITVDDFTDIGALTLKLLYDPLTLAYQSATPNAAFNASNFSVTSSAASGGLNQLVISYPYGEPAVTLSDGSTMVTLSFTFTVVNFTANHSVLEWDDDGTSCEYRDDSNVILNDSPTADFYINGLVASQVAPITYLPDTQFYATGSVEIPLTVDNFDQIATFSLTFEYDSTVINYEESYTSSLTGLSVGDSPSSGTLKRIVIGWFGGPLTLADGSEIISLDFTYNLGSTTISWIDNGPDCEYSETNFIPLYDTPTDSFYIEGIINQKMAPRIYLDTIPGYAGEVLAMPVTVENFIAINSLSLTLDYDPLELDFECATPEPSLGGSFDAAVNLSDQIEITWTGSSEVTLADGSVLFYLAFLPSGNTTSLQWYNVGSTCEFTTGPSFTALNDLPTIDYYFDGLIEQAPGTATWTGTTSSDWNVASNWDVNQVPDSFFDVLITTNNSPSNWPVFTGNFTVGSDCRDLTLEGAAEWTVSGNLTIDTDHEIVVTGNGTIKTGGNWTNNGLFSYGSGTVDFYGTTPGTIIETVTPGNSLGNYTVETFTAGMTDLSGATAGPTGNDAQSDVSIGFTFTYLGVDYTQARVNTNGYLSLDLTGDVSSSGENSKLFYLMDPTNVVAPWWDDLNADGSTQVSYLTEGTAPNRVFTVEWKNILAYSTGSTARLNFQVKLYETTNVIEFHYGSLVAGTHNPNESASIGLKGSTGGQGDFLEVTNNSTEVPISCLDSGNGSWPSVNYRILPPPNANKEIFWQVHVTKNDPGTLQVSRDTDVKGTSP